MPFAPIHIRPDQLSHLVTRASAGSGKTHQLVSRYLQLIAAGAPPASILASTFTRLAAGQIRDKILRALADAAKSEKERSQLATRLGFEHLSREAVMDMLAHLSRSLHRMQVRTLDSFFAAIVRGFAVDLDLPLGAAIIDEARDAQMRDEAIRLMLDERKPQELVDLLRKLIHDRAERGVCETINSTVSSLHALFLEAPREAWACVPMAPGRLSRAETAAAITALENVDAPSDQRTLKAHVKAVEAARARRWSDFLNAGLAAAMVSGKYTYHGQRPPDDVIAVYEPLVRHARAEIIGRIRDQNQATCDLLTSFDHHYRAAKNAHHAITFGDLADAMARAAKLGKMDDICFRIDATLRHMLLDEFQDTSIPQWWALEPMAREIVAVAPPDRTFFCVGDGKQSIYGWRSAAPEVLDELPRLLTGGDGTSAIETKTLSRSYRSSPVIMTAVNTVFESLDHNEALDNHQDAAMSWSAGFEPHSTAKDFAGRVELRVMTRIDSDSSERSKSRCRAAAELVAELHRRNPRMTIAVLARTRKAVTRMLFELGPNQLNIPATGHGGGPLTDASAVNAILDLLRLADHPDDKIAAFNVAHSPVGAMIGLTDYKTDQQRRSIAQHIRRLLLTDGYAAAISRWVAQLAGACDQRELGRLVQLVELAGTHDPQRSLRTGDFIKRVEDTAVPSTQPAPVQVMTIHQSKGLEFDAVILPELDWKLVGRSPPVVFEREGETGPITQICCHMNAEFRALLPELQPLFDRHDRRTARESLSLLYVAMTRAKRGLYMMIDPPELKKDGTPSENGLRTAAGVVRSALAPDGVVPELLAYEDGDPAWMKTITDEQPASSAASTNGLIHKISLAKPVHACTRGIKARSASQHDAPAPLTLVHSESRQRGTVIHSLFEQIEWLDEFIVDDEVLLAITRRKSGRRDDSWLRTQVAAFIGGLKHSQVIQTLSANGRDKSRVTVHREHPIARVVDGRVQLGSIDRLVVEHDAFGAVQAASIIDYKTDAIAAGDCSSCANQYVKQLDTYQEVAAAWLGIPPQNISKSLLFVTPGVRIDL